MLKYITYIDTVHKVMNGKLYYLFVIKSLKTLIDSSPIYCESLSADILTCLVSHAI